MNNIYIPNQEIIIPVGKVLIEITNVLTGKVDRGLTDNMVVTAGKNAIAAGLMGETSNNKGIITYCAMGTSAVAPALADVQLAAEIGRKLISVRSVSGKVATFQTFFTTAEVIGTLREAGLFGDDASGTANSGTLFCRTAINRVKTSNDTLSLSWAVTIG